MKARSTHTTDKARMLWAFAITSIALFMTTLDNLVVTTALPVIRHDLHASLAGLEWTVNAYTFTFAVLLLTGAALGDRFGRRRLFAIGLAIFTGGSALAALAGSANELIAARAIQGLGGAIVLPLTLTILSAAVPPNRRGLALGAWGGIGGLAVALGPLVGGAIVQGISWQWIFWLNVPFGLVLIPLALRQLQETHGPNSRLDLPGLALSAGGLLAIVWGLVRGNDAGWTSVEVASALFAGAVVLALFVLWELRATAPMLPMRFFRNRTFTAANLASLFMFFGMFGSIFLLAQYFQTVQGSSPLEAGLRILPWTAMPILIAPIAGLLSDRIGGRPIMATGLALQATGLAWIGAILTTTLPYSSIVIPFTLSGIGMAMYFAPVANVVLSSVKPDEEGQASGANNAIRELGGVFGVAVLAAVFSHYGGYQTPASFVHGVTPALYLGAALVAIGAATALLIPRRRRRSAEAPQIGRSGRTTRRVSLVVGVVVISAIVASTTASATTTPSTRQAAGEAVLVIPAPTGAYPVGTRSLELVDPSRHEPGTNGRKPRSLVIQLWYPRAPGNGKREPYMPAKVAAYIAGSGGLPTSIFTRLKLAAISNAVPLHRAGGLARRLVLNRLRNRTAALHRPRRRPRQPRLRRRRNRSPTRRQHRRLPRRPHRLDRQGRREQQRNCTRADRPHRRHQIRAQCTDAARPRQTKRVLRNPQPRPHRDVRPLPRRRHSSSDDAHRPQNRCRPRHGRLPLRQGRHHGAQQTIHALRRRPRIPAPAKPRRVLEPPTRTPLRSRLRRRRPPRVHRPRLPRAPVGRHEQSRSRKLACCR